VSIDPINGDVRVSVEGPRLSDLDAPRSAARSCEPDETIEKRQKCGAKGQIALVDGHWQRDDDDRATTTGPPERERGAVGPSREHIAPCRGRNVEQGSATRSEIDEARRSAPKRRR
jgi:hypothetical protein